MTIDLRQWRQQYVNAARANEIPALRSLISELGGYLREMRTPAAKPQFLVEPSATWQELCSMAQDEKDPEKLLAMVQRINTLLEQEELSRRR